MEEADPRARLSLALLRPASLREISLALGLPTGLFVASSINWRLRNHPGILFTDRRMAVTLAIELLIACCVVPYLARRDWKPLEVSGSPEPWDFLRGIGLWVGIIVVFSITYLMFLVATPGFVAPIRGPQFSGALSPATVVTAALINPVFEEFLWLGYGIPALGNRFGLRAGALVSVTLRVIVHAYQGRLAIVAILPLALVMTWYFVRTGRLWPVVAAHVIVDTIGLSGLLRTP